ncbi:MAG: chemotaxis protein CheW [Pseudomonadales bacterium]|nr:chemotaxis protein CheW [Pseudomonadales bacterium]
MSTNSSTVLDSLLRMDELARQIQSDEQVAAEHHGEWRGLAFMLNGQPVISATHEITEIIELPESITIVPDTPEWMVGLANFHGEVLPISDLQCFVGNPPVNRDYQSKVLVVKNHGRYTGFLVPSVTGFRYFPENKKQEYTPLGNLLDMYIYDLFEIDGESWPVINMAAVISNKRFLMN